MNAKQNANAKGASKQKSDKGQQNHDAKNEGQFAVSTPVARVRLPNGDQKILTTADNSANAIKVSNQKQANNIGTNNVKKSKKSTQASKNLGTPESKQKEKLQSSASDKIEQTLVQFSERAQELRGDITSALEKQTQRSQGDSGCSEPPELMQLRESIKNLSGESCNSDSVGVERTDEASCCPTTGADTADALAPVRAASDVQELNGVDLIQSDPEPQLVAEPSAKLVKEQAVKDAKEHQDIKANVTIDDQEQSFEPLMSQLDPQSKFLALKASLQKHFEGAPQMLEPVCKKLIQMSEANQKLAKQSQHHRGENEKLLSIKDKLEQLCRELQRSNNSMRIESLDAIKLEQSKAKEQAAKIQATLSGVIKLFDENQQRNLVLKQENVDLQNKLRALLEHCDAWEKSVEAALKQRDIEVRLLKTELAKTNLVRNEEKEGLLGEKKELLRVLATMQEQQHKIEGQEAKLRSDLANYANKYDQCQTAISSGLSKFQIESKRMLKQLEKSKQDYVDLLNKYETSNKRLAQLMEERARLDKLNKQSNKKVETLERLCRALKSGEACSACADSFKGSIAADCKRSDKNESDENETNTAAHIDCPPTDKCRVLSDGGSASASLTPVEPSVAE